MVHFALVHRSNAAFTKHMTKHMAKHMTNHMAKHGTMYLFGQVYQAKQLISIDSNDPVPSPTKWNQGSRISLAIKNYLKWFMWM